jgi:hypothetical protein
MKKNRNKEIIDNVASVLLSRKNKEEALELRELCMLARVSATEAFRAVNHLIDAGFEIRVTDELPRRFYYDNG